MSWNAMQATEDARNHVRVFDSKEEGVAWYQKAGLTNVSLSYEYDQLRGMAYVLRYEPR